MVPVFLPHVQSVLEGGMGEWVCMPLPWPSPLTHECWAGLTMALELCSLKEIEVVKKRKGKGMRVFALTLGPVFSSKTLPVEAVELYGVDQLVEVPGISRRDETSAVAGYRPVSGQTNIWMYSTRA
ncbi:hypothetical protein JZ751_002850 [Albula glossodonta]|uniref:Uncharacterized protein n=1 Tax=Albula glossodonta TaxID=121402 RepID=A0A8T2N816_9TELE|nr:hypothetical protein JZ751_002850 [Albula glossodonta]